MLAVSSASSSFSAVAQSGTSGLAASARSATSPIARLGRLDRQRLVAAHGFDQAVHLRRQRRQLQRLRAVARDARGHLHDHVVRQVRQRAAVVRVDDLDVAAAVVERGDQLRGRLAVEGAAAVLEQLRLRVEGRVAVQLEQVALDVHDLLRARVAVELLRAAPTSVE